MKLFVSETEDLILQTEGEILKIEKNPKALEPIQKLFYTFHTLKGLTAMAGFNNTSKFCHYFESFLQSIKDNQDSVDLSNSIINMLFESLEVLRSVLNNVKNGDMTDIDPSLLLDLRDSFDSFDSSSEMSFIEHIQPNKFSAILGDKSNKFYKVYIRLQSTCAFKKVRLFIIFRALTEKGQICWGVPDPESLEQGEIINDFEIYYISHSTDKEIVKILNEILEIENKAITKLENKEFEGLLNEFDLKWTRILEKKATKRSRESYHVEIEDDEEFIDGEIETSSHVFEDYSDEGTKISSVKVDVDILDKLMNYFGEIVILKNQITRTLKERQDRVLGAIVSNMEKPFLDIQELIFGLKLVRVETTFVKYKRLIRDVAKETGKKIRFILEGTNVEIDRKILEELNSPLVHLLRNAVYHGIESPELRMKKTKNQIGLLRLKTYRSAGSIYIEVTDDGQGIDYDRVKDVLVQKGLFLKEEVEHLNTNVLNQYILQPNFSTLSGANLISGRGIGLAIVVEKIRELGGSLKIHSEKDVGTTFTLIVPFSRAILKAQLFHVAGELFAIPIEYIETIFQFKQEKAEYVENTLYYKFNSKLIPAIQLEQHFQFKDATNEDLRLHSKSKVAILCKKDDMNSAVFIVDDIMQQTDIVVKPFKSNYSDSRDILGSTILDDGSVCLILDVLTIITSKTNEIRTFKF
jgi:two-component system chemotaxis sensor kinase CheA